MPSCTHAMNLAIHGILKKGDHAVATAIDHNATLRPLAALRARGIIDFTIVEAREDGTVEPDAIRRAIRKNTKVIYMNHASNLLGTIQNVGAWIQIAHEAGAIACVDAAQTAGHLPIDMHRMGIDILAVPSHKGLLGPSGAGALLVSKNIHIEPGVYGGTGHDSENLTPNVEFPGSFEMGTGNPGGIVAWGAGLGVVADAGVDTFIKHDREMIGLLIDKLINSPRVHLYGPRDISARVGVLAISIDGVEAHEAGAILDASFGISVRAGIACAPYAAKACRAPEGGLIRISVGRTTTADEIETTAGAIHQIAGS